MTYPKQIMKLSELKKMGYPEAFLMRAFRAHGQTFATRLNPFKENSPIIFDTEGLEKWRLSQVRASQGSALI